MSDTPEAPPTPETPDPTPAPEAGTAAADAPAADTSAAATPGPAVPPAAPLATAPAPAPERRKPGSVQVPVWLLVVVTVVVVGVGAFFVGRATAPDSGDAGPHTLAEAVEETARGDMPVGDFDAADLLRALGQNRDLDLGALGDLILGQGRRN